MAATCRSCGATLPVGAGRCPACLAIVKPPGFFQRLFGWFKFSLIVNAKPGSALQPGVHFQTTVQRTYKIRDAATGEMKEYHSLDEIPAQYREKMRQTLAQAPVAKKQSITLTGPDGVTRTYQSLDEVPHDIRALIERAQKSPDASQG